MATELKVLGPGEHHLKGHAGNPPGQGPFITLTLTVGQGRIQDASYETFQCPGAVACGRAVCDLVRGRTIAEARQITRDTVAKRVGPLERHRQIAYGLAALALSNALDQLVTG